MKLQKNMSKYLVLIRKSLFSDGKYYQNIPYIYTKVCHKINDNF